MKLLKSIYIGLLIPSLILLTGLIVYGFYHDGFTLNWLGSALTCVPFLLFMLRAVIFQNQPRTNPNIPIVTGLVLVGITISLFAYINKETIEDLSIYALFTSLIASLLLFLFIGWFSWLDRTKSPSLKKGGQLPEFKFWGDETITNSNQLLGKPAVIIFYRGNWCPFCVAQIKEVVSGYQQAIYSGVQFILISPQPDKITKKMAQKFDVPFMFLTDIENAAAKKLGIIDKNGLPLGLADQGFENSTVYPTVIVTDKDGKILYCDQTENYRIRPDAKEYLQLVVNN